MVEPEDHQRVGIGENPLVNRQLLAGLIDALVDGDGLPRYFADDALKVQQRKVEELERPLDALQKHLIRICLRFVRRPRDAAHFGHRRKPIVQLSDVAIRFPGVTPRPINAEAAFAFDVWPRYVELVICAAGRAHCIWSSIVLSDCFTCSAFLISSAETNGYSPYSMKLGRWCSRTNLMNAGTFVFQSSGKPSRFSNAVFKPAFVKSATA